MKAAYKKWFGIDLPIAKVGIPRSTGWADLAVDALQLQLAGHLA